jgi:hypothetical protein
MLRGYFSGHKIQIYSVYKKCSNFAPIFKHDRGGGVTESGEKRA